jgi:hypothetical protein
MSARLAVASGQPANEVVSSLPDYAQGQIEGLQKEEAIV